MLQILRKLLRKRSSCQKLTDTNPVLLGFPFTEDLKMSKIKRQSGIELLRIIAMIQIIFACVSVRITSWRIKGRRRYWRYIGDICMVIMQNPCWCVYYDKRLLHDNLAVWYKKTIRRGGKIYGAMIFYSIILSIIFFISDPSLININSVIKAFTPLMSRTWYFLSNYLIILLLSPFLNKMLASLSKNITSTLWELFLWQ